MTFGRNARIAAAIALLIALGVLVPPFVGLNRYKSSVAGAMRRALGRDVSVGSVHLRLLPQPGLTLENFVVAEDPHFGDEPMLRANEVVATLRLTSLWRARLEIASLSLKEPSLNLVRSADGHWNIESLLLRAAQTPTAPTVKPRPESRTRFPYIEASAGRINFKFGQEKKVWALTDADFALWLASEDEWSTRLLARPVRTDATLSDTGVIRINGTLRRTSRVEETLVSFHVTLDDAQLGQFSTLVYGRDRDWRGTTTAVLDISGTPAHLTLAATAAVDHFRRYDITPPDSLRLQVRCVSEYWPASQRLTGIECHLPTDDGDISARGSINSIFDQPVYDLGFTARDVPMSYAIAFARRAKKDLPADLTAGGVLAAALSLRSAGDHVVWAGGGGTKDFALQSATLVTPLNLGVVEFVMQPQTPPGAALPRSRAAAPVPVAYNVTVPAFALPLGAAQPATAQAVFTHDGYSMQVAGTAAIARLLQAARAAGVPAPANAVQGAATHMNLEIAGEWRGFQQPLVTGSSDVQNARFQLAGVAAPVQISSANVVLQPEQVEVQNLSASMGTVAFSGTIRQSRRCPSPVPCRAEFVLRADRVSLDDLNRLFNPRLSPEPWYRRLGGGSAPPPLLTRLHASGQVSIARLAVKTVALQNVSGTLRLDPGVAEFSAATATLFGGAVRGGWHAEFGGSDPVYFGNGTVQRLALAQLSTAMRDNWATGTANAQYRVSASGWTSADLLRSAAATLDFDWRDGSLRHLILASSAARLSPAQSDAAALRVVAFRGRAVLRDDVLTLSDSRLQTPSASYTVAGTATSARELELTFSLNTTQQYNVSGTLASPRVQSVVLTTQRSSIQR